MSAALQQLASNGLAPRAFGDDPRLGVDLEVRRILLENNAKEKTGRQKTRRISKAPNLFL
jgi:hypothetical protein